MKPASVFIYFAASACLAISSLGLAQAPSGSTGQCKDGSYTSAETKRGSCKGHGGVKEWYASEGKSEEKSAKAGTKAGESKTTSTSATGTAAAPAPAAAPKTSSVPTATKTSQGMRAEAAPGGGAGKVWVNTSSHVYHCSGDEWYGKTKAGEYMTEAEAKAKGAHAAHGKACS